MFKSIKKWKKLREERKLELRKIHQEEYREQKEWETKQKEINKKLEKVRLFPESKEEYEKFVGYKVEIIDTGNKNLGVSFHQYTIEKVYQCDETFKRKKQLLDNGIEALVNCKKSYDSISCFGGGQYTPVYYGLPVKKTEMKE